MHSSDGQQLAITVTFADDKAGPLTFSHYREEPEPEDLRLHLPDRIGTENSLQQLQRAYVEKEVVAQRQHRQAARAAIQNTAPDPAKVQAARELNTQLAEARKPRGRGAGMIITKGG